MNLQTIRPGDALPSAPELTAREIDAVAFPAGPALPPRMPGVSLYALVDAFGGEPAGACQGADGKETVEGGEPVACPHNAGQEQSLDERVQAAARLAVDGVLLDRPDTWYAVGPRAAGFCPACRARMSAHLESLFGEQYVAFDPMEQVAKASEDGPTPPYWREQQTLRLRSAVEHGARLARRVRDEVRRVRSAETFVGAHLTGITPAGLALARKLDFVTVPAPTPSPDRSRVGTYEILRAALSRRAVVGVLEPEAAQQPGLVLQAARLAAAAGAQLTLPTGAPAESHQVLAQHRKFWREFRSRYRPVDRLTEALLLYSPECDHFTRGRHGAGVRALAEALTALSAQFRVVMSVPREGSEPLILADAGALPEADAARLDRRVTEGASAIVVGACQAADEEGRPIEGPFTELSAGLNKVGAGTVFGIEPGVQAAGTADRRWEPLVPVLDKALESLLGRGRRAASCSKPSVVVKMFLDPERKLDVHLVGRAFDPKTYAPEVVKGCVVHLAGAAVSGARTGYLFTQEGPERKVALTPYGMGVQAQLPDFVGAAVLTVAR